MVQIALDLDFSLQLVLYLAFYELLLAEHLESDDELGFLLPGQEYISELAFA